jgi:hypothetical protein
LEGLKEAFEAPDAYWDELGRQLAAAVEFRDRNIGPDDYIYYEKLLAHREAALESKSGIGSEMWEWRDGITIFTEILVELRLGLGCGGY